MPGDVIIELHRPSVEFWIEPSDGPGQWITASRFEGRLHVRGTYVDATPHAIKLARVAYETMEDAFKKIPVGRPSIKVRIKS